MCILFIAVEQHPKYPLIICANRDEFHARPTQSMHVWQQPKILAGKDLEAGGTWLGLAPSGKFAALTNYRSLPLSKAPKKSRGDLVIKALTSSEPDLLTALKESAHQYHGYNLVYGSPEQLYCYDSFNNKHHTLSKGIHSICNGALDDIWPKMKEGQKLLEDAIYKKDDLSIDTLFELMANDKQALPNLLPDTGLSQEWEQLLSAIFIVSPTYGTRSTSIITYDLNGRVQVFDQSYTPSGESHTKRFFDIKKELFR
mgnify:CR=1 FL=1